MRNTGKGSYRVRLRSEKTSHMDFSDLQVLAARAPAEREIREQVLATVRSYTRAFFDRHIRGMRSPLLDGRAPGRFVETVQKFGPAKRPK